MKILLDIHYSDTWADPQHQNVPGAWLGETLPQLAASTQNYTQSVIQAFAANGTPVSQVAIGNEITEGLLWQFTQLSGSTAAGTTSIPVDSASGISAGDTLYIDSLANSNSVAGVADPSTDIATVKAVSGNTITLTRPLAHAHAAAATVQDVQDSGHLLFNDSTGTADWNSLTTLIKAGVAGARAGQPGREPAADPAAHRPGRRQRGRHRLRAAHGGGGSEVRRDRAVLLSLVPRADDGA